MSRLTLTHFDPQPSGAELPARFPSPFDPGPPHPLARRAAVRLQEELRRVPPGAGSERGKMFGVLVVVDGSGRVGWLQAFSGMLGGRWHQEGFVGPLFDLADREAFWPAGEGELLELDRSIEACVAERIAATAELDRLSTVQAAALEALGHPARKQRRQASRAKGAALPEAERRALLAALARESQADAAARRDLRAAQRAERAPPEAALRALEARRLALGRQRVARSCELLERLFAGYQIRSAAGQWRSLRALFAPATPPGGSGDCAAPKLLAHAHRAGLRPIALAEFWWGPPPVTGGRHDGRFYPACRGKCGPVLGHLLDGLSVEPAPLFGAGPVAADEPRTVYEDRWLLVVDKPVGLLSVPGRAGPLRDSVLVRLAARHPEATGPLLVHRLDLDTSGLLLAAKDADTHRALQAQLCRREIDKRYLAWLDGPVDGESGTIELPLRVDLDDRPRQIHDPVHGKPAVTEWRVLARAGARTRVALWPRTGRTHQLRVHAAHPLGLGAAVVGDRLYGTADERLMLHAESLSFLHPRTGQRLTIDRPAPF
jgi:tRNA pseudouridine32 synthase/23S rRNA pseudouridine746 synthase